VPPQCCARRGHILAMTGQSSVDGEDKETQSGTATYRHTSQIDTTLTRNGTVQEVEL